MASNPARPLSAAERRWGMRLSYFNAGLWSLGNGLTSTSLVVYLGLEFGARGIATSLILAAPQLVGLLRLATPAFFAPLGGRKAFCARCYWLSGAALFVLPLISAPGVLPDKNVSLAALIVLWTVYHVLEYLGTVALWAWLGDLAPRPIRGRFIGRRERWLLVGRILGMAMSGLFAYAWTAAHVRGEWWIGYALPAAAGAGFMMLAVLPLRAMPAADDRPRRSKRRGASMEEGAVSSRPPAGIVELVGHLRRMLEDGPFVMLIIYGCWFSFVNGLTNASMHIYFAQVLGFSLLWRLGFEAGLRGGQSALSPTVGRLADLVGNRPVMIVAQLLVAAGPLFYFVATPGQPWWVAGAWILWIAYVGLNVGLPNLMLKLAPEGNSAGYVAAYFAVSGACFAASTLAGGLAHDVLAGEVFQFHWGLVSFRLDYFAWIFLLGALLRAVAAELLARVQEEREA
jgi:MFS family permease